MTVFANKTQVPIAKSRAEIESMLVRYKASKFACRARWRALALVIKAKLEAVESGITTFEEEFLAHIVLPDGTTLGQWAAPRLAHVYDTGAMPPMLPGGPS
jgi:hypothetical protein